MIAPVDALLPEEVAFCSFVIFSHRVDFFVEMFVVIHFDQFNVPVEREESSSLITISFCGTSSLDQISVIDCLIKSAGVIASFLVIAASSTKAHPESRKEKIRKIEKFLIL